MICSKCGLVVGDRVIDVSSEWRTFSDGKDNSRVGWAENPLVENNDLSTVIETSKGYVKILVMDLAISISYLKRMSDPISSTSQNFLPIVLPSHIFFLHFLLFKTFIVLKN